MSSEQVKQLLNYPGILEFRIVADDQQLEHAEAIALAKAKPGNDSGNLIRNNDSGVVAKWVALRSRAKLLRREGIVVRKNNRGKEEILVVVDPYNVNGEYLTRAYPSGDGSAVNFELNSEGAKLLGELTGANLPDLRGRPRQIAVILDDELVSDVGMIRGKITSGGQITGRFTKSDLDYLTDVLNSGRSPIPAVLELVSDSKNN
jgi:preprotein translocase subunit SecD